MNKDSRIYVAGHTGLVGSAVVRELRRKGYTNLIIHDHFKNHNEKGFDKNANGVDLRCGDCVLDLFYQEEPEYVFLAAAHAGGIKEAIDHPVEMLSDNILIQTNVINACHEFGVKKLINFGSSCLYPVDAEQPYREEQLGTGKTDENWSYAVAKLAGIELCRAYHRQHGSNFMTVMPCNIYGINDRFDEFGHVIPSLIRKFHGKDSMSIWGNPETKREFLYSDDLATICVNLMEGYCYEDLKDGVLNVGSGVEVSMLDLVETIRKIVRTRATHDAVYSFDGKSDKAGVPSKLMDSSRMRALGLEPKITLEDGIRRVFDSYCACDKSGKRQAA